MWSASTKRRKNGPRWPVRRLWPAIRPPRIRRGSALHDALRPAAGNGGCQTRGHLHAGESATELLGKLLMAENLRDILWSLDYLAGHETVDRERIGCVGLSLGGRMTMLAAAVEPRIRVAAMSVRSIVCRSGP